ncbi:MAG TPA: hypothetical protein VFR86_28615, partial [Burkholderiaceae bacterium]|nr:hypothetical protein [Burkholderiaceae bacterium]
MLDRLLARWRVRRSPPVHSSPRLVEDSDSPWRFVTRAPLIDKYGGIVGWRLRALTRHQDDGEAAAAQAARALASRGTIALTRLPVGSKATPLERGPLAQLARGCIVEITDRHLAAFQGGLAATVAHLRARGITTAIAQPALALLVPPDWLLIDVNGSGDAEQARRQRRTFELERPPIVCGLRSLGEIEAALRDGAALAGGTLGTAPTPAGAGATTQLPPRVANAAQFLEAVLEERPPRALVSLLSRDIGNVYRILRATNETVHQWGYRRGSLYDALRMWHGDERHRRACALVLTAAPARPFVRALQELALARGRLMESVAIVLNKEDAPPAALFATGAFSLIGAILGTPLAVAVPMLPLPRPGHATLLERAGPWRSFLDL